MAPELDHQSLLTELARPTRGYEVLAARWHAKLQELHNLPKARQRALRRRWRQGLAGIALALVLGGSLVSTQPAQAANITVDGDGTAGTCSLENAILAANNDAVYGYCGAGSSGADTITLDTDVTLGSAYASGDNGLPVISSEITIDGQTTYTISRSAGAPAFRILEVSSGADLTIKDATISGGSTSKDGGGIYNYGTVTITNSTLSGNLASNGHGGGIFNNGGTVVITDNSELSDNSSYYHGGGINNSVGVLTIDSSTLSGNTASQGRGGGIFNSGGTVTISNTSTLDANSAYYGGGGISNFGGTVTISNSTLSGNSVSYGDGGGIGQLAMSGDAIVTIENSTLSGNYAYGDGGGIHQTAYGGNGTIALNSSTLSGNYASEDGGGIHQRAWNYGNATLTISNSTLNGNTAYYDGGGIGQMAWNNGSTTVAISNSTLSGNSAASEDGGGIHQMAYIGTCMITLNDSTLTGNFAAGNGGGVGGFAFNGTGMLTFNRSLISGNIGSTGDEIFNSGGLAVGDNYNVWGDNSKTGLQAFYGFTPFGTDINATSSSPNAAALGAILNTTLADNGGPTQTHALVLNSPAVDRVPTTDSACNPGTSTDQRGAARGNGVNQGGSACDTGAYEYAASQTPTVIALEAFSAASAVPWVPAAARSLVALLLGGWLTKMRKRR